MDIILEGFRYVLASLSFPFVIEKGVFMINMGSLGLFLYIKKITAKRLASAVDVQHSLFLSNDTSYFSNILEASVPVLNKNIR